MTSPERLEPLPHRRGGRLPQREVPCTAFDDAGKPDDACLFDLTGTFTSFTPTNPTTVTADGEDTAALEVGTIVTLEALTGTTEGMAAIAGVVSAVLTVNPTTLDLDLSAVDTDGLTADYVRG